MGNIVNSLIAAFVVAAATILSPNSANSAESCSPGARCLLGETQEHKELRLLKSSHNEFGVEISGRKLGGKLFSLALNKPYNAKNPHQNVAVLTAYVDGATPVERMDFIDLAIKLMESDKAKFGELLTATKNLRAMSRGAPQAGHPTQSLIVR